MYPPVFFSVAQYELMRPDVEAMTGMLEDVGQAVETHVWSGQITRLPGDGHRVKEATMTIAFKPRLRPPRMGYRGRTPPDLQAQRLDLLAQVRLGLLESRW